MRPSAGGPSFSLGGGIVALTAVSALMLAGLSLGGWRLVTFTFSFSDLTSYFAPKYAYAAQQIAAWRLPLWNPFEFCGLPFLAATEPGVLYPPLRLVYGLLTGDAAHLTFFFLHLAIGGATTLALMRSLGCGLWASVLAAAWVVQPGWLVRVYDHPNILAAVAWIPALVLLLRRAVLTPSTRAAALLATAAATQMLTSYPPASLATAYVLSIWLVLSLVEARQHPGRSLAAVSLAALVAGLLAAAQVVPGAALTVGTGRAAESTWVQDALVGPGSGSVKGRNIAFYAFGIREVSLARTAAELWREFGPLALLGLVAPLAWPRRPAVWGAAVSMALATLAPLGWLFQLPLYGFVRFGLEWTFVAPFAVYVLAGLGLDAALAHWPPRRWVAPLLVLATLGGATAWAWHSVPRRLIKLRPPDAPTLPAPAARACGLDDPQARLFWPAGLSRGLQVSHRLRSIGGYEQSLMPARMARLAEEIDLGNGAVSRDYAQRLARHSAVAARMALRCVVTHAEQPVLAAAGFIPVSDGRARDLVYANPGALPRARMLFAGRPASSPDEALALLLSGDVDPRQAVIVEGVAAPELPACPTPEKASITISEDAPETVRLRVDAPCAGYVVLADTYVPGWLATVDGLGVPIRAADYVFRAVLVPAGLHDVTFVYRPDSVRIGFLVSTLGVGLVLGLCLLPRKRDPLRGPHPRGGRSTGPGGATTVVPHS